MIAPFLQALRQPEYVHVLLNPLPVYGLAVSIIGLVIALCQRSRPAEVAMLALIVFCGVIAWPVGHYGEEAYDRALSLSDEQGQAWLKVHAQRADQFIFYFYALALIALAAILAPRKWPQSALGLTSITLVLAFVVLAMGGYIGYAGGRIRHREFRREPAPVPPVAQDEH
ncbi:MAG: hypothetical protein H0X40_19395 [Chthoniobacterales bacterium]|nr:hypothetical protein [Chthoniobacterales bacterium]